MVIKQEDEELSKNLLFGDPNVPDQDALDDKLKKYLLRDPNFTEDEIGELEELLLDNERYFERMMLVEGELIEDFLRGALSANEVQRFKQYFLVTPERRDKLESVKSLALSYAESSKFVEANLEFKQPKPAPVAWWKSILASLNSSNLFAGVAAAAVLIILSIGAIWWLSQSRDSLIATSPTNLSAQNVNTLKNSDQSEIVHNIENEASTTPQPSSADTPLPRKTPQGVQTPKQIEKPVPAPVTKPTENASSSVVFALFSGVLRSEGNAVEGKIKPGIKSVKLNLQLNLEKTYEDFLVVVEDSNGTEIARRGKLKKVKNKELLTVEFPAENFKPDDYTVRLSGKTNSEYTSIARYSFRILK